MGVRKRNSAERRREALKEVASKLEVFAEAGGLAAHSEAVQIRFEDWCFALFVATQILESSTLGPPMTALPSGAEGNVRSAKSASQPSRPQALW